MRPVTGERLRVWAREDFGVDLGPLDEVRHGADEAAQMWHATSTNSKRYAVKLSGGGTPAGLLVTDHLARFGVPGIAGPVRTRMVDCGVSATGAGCPWRRGCLTAARSAAG